MPTAEHTWPGVQYPHCSPSWSTNACWTGCRASPSARPAAVTTSLPSWATARDRHESVRRPSSSTVQAPHCPWSQPFLGEVTPSRSRSASSREVRVSTLTVRSRPSTCKVMVASTRLGYPGRTGLHAGRGPVRRARDEVRPELTGQSRVHAATDQGPLACVVDRVHLPGDVDPVEQVAAVVGQERLERHPGPGQ